MDYLVQNEDLRLHSGTSEHYALQKLALGRPAYPTQSAADASVLPQTAVELQRLASLGAYAGRVAHDFNNLLTPIISAAQLAMLDASPDDELAALLEHILVAARRASDLSRELSRYARQDTLQRTRVNISRLVSEMLSLLRVTLAPEAELRCELPAALWLEANPVQLRQAVMNLVADAAEAVGRSPGVVSITVGAADIDARSPVPGLLDPLPDGRYAYLRVAETGCGLDQATCERALSLGLVDVDDVGSIGLSATSAIARAHHGSLSVVREPGRGSTCTLWLPLAGSVMLAGVPDTHCA